MAKPDLRDQDDKLASLLKQARKSADLTQTELARRLGRPQSFVAKYEGGERRLYITEFLQIAKELSVSTNKFLKQLEDSA